MEILEQTKDKEFWAWFLEMGLGKTDMALVQAAYLFNCKLIDQALFISKNGVDQQIIDEGIPAGLPLEADHYFAECWHDSGEWRKFNKFRGQMGDRLVLLGINCEALGTKRGFEAIRQLALHKRTFIAIDESQEFSGLDAIRTKNLLSIAPSFPYRRLMSGTPSGGNPIHYLPQMNILSPRIFATDKWGFEYKYCVKEKQSTWMKAPKDIWRKGSDGKSQMVAKKGSPYQKFFETITDYKNLDQLQETIGRYSSRRTKAECLDLPEKLYTKVVFELSEEERKLYNKVKTSILAELAPGKYVSADLAITKLIRLHQIACGFAVFEDLVTGERGQTLLAEPSRLKALKEKCAQVTSKTLIWSRFTTSTDHIIEMLKEQYGPDSVVRYDGTVSSAQKQINKLLFKKEKYVQWLVGNPKAGGVGLDLPEAENAFYYSNDYHLISRLQSEDRCHRIGTKHPVTYVDFVANNTIDDRILKALKSHFDIATKLTGDQLRSWIT